MKQNFKNAVMHRNSIHSAIYAPSPRVLMNKYSQQANANLLNNFENIHLFSDNDIENIAPLLQKINSNLNQLKPSINFNRNTKRFINAMTIIKLIMTYFRSQLSNINPILEVLSKLIFHVELLYKSDPVSFVRLMKVLAN